MEIFSFPAVYDTAFQFRNTQKTLDFIEQCIKTYAEIPVHTIVDIACGTGHYTREFARRNYTVYGIDINAEICQYARWKAQVDAVNVTILCEDMVDFSLPVCCELAVSFFDSLTYVADVRSLDEHFHSVSRVLSPGGLYIIEIGVIDDFENHNVEEVWTEVRRDFSVTTTYFRDGWINPENGRFEEQCSFRAMCRQHVAFFQVKFLKLALYFEEFDRIVRRTGVFTPLACYESFNADTLLNGDAPPWRIVGVLKRQ